MPSALGRAQVIEPAARWRVFLAAAIDVAVMAVVSSTTAGVELWLIGALGFRPTHRAPIDIAAEWFFLHGSAALHGLLVAVALGFVLGVWPGARTLGRRITGTEVVRSSGRPFSMWVMFLRGVGLLLTIGSLGLGFLWALFDPHRRSWHDLLAGTVTVRRSDIRQGDTVVKA